MADVTLFSALRKASVVKAAPRTLSGVGDSRSGWWQIFGRDLHFQTDVEVNRESVLAQSTVFACMTLIASDIGKLSLNLVERDTNGIWTPTTIPAFSPVLRRPNSFQSMQQFLEQWMFSLLSFGNTYILKERDKRGVVVALYILDPSRVTVLIAEDGSIFYQLQTDNLANITEPIAAAPASEIIHDRYNHEFHPLVGIPPVFAYGLSATQALKIQTNSAKFFENMSQPGGILTAPTKISDTTAARLKEYFDKNFSGRSVGKVAVLGDNLKYEQMSVNPVEAELVDQLKLTAAQICSAFHVPAYMVGAGEVPPNNNIQALTIQYFGQCLQSLMKRVEEALDYGLGLSVVKGKTLGTMFDKDELFLMDTETMANSLKILTGAGITSPNEARRKLNYGPVPGGGTPYLQEQNWPLDQLTKRDISERPATAPKPIAPPQDDKAREEAAAAKAAADQANAAVQELTQKLAEAQVEKSEERSEAFMVKMFDKMTSTFGVKAQEPEDDPDPFIEHFDSLEPVDA